MAILDRGASGEGANLRYSIRSVQRSSLGFLEYVRDDSVEDCSGVPTPLDFARRFRCQLRFVLYHSLVPNRFDFSVYQDRFFFRANSSLVNLALAFVRIVTRYFFAFAVARLAHAICRNGQALSIVIARFRSSLALVQRIAVNAQCSSLSIGTRLQGFVIEVLYLRGQYATRDVHVIEGTNFVMVLLSNLCHRTLIP